MDKPTEASKKTISELVEQARHLKQQMDQFEQKDFRTPTQQEAEGADGDLYLWRLSHTDPCKCEKNFGYISHFFVSTGSPNKGRFVLDTGGDIDWYNPDRHKTPFSFVYRCELDRKLLHSTIKARAVKVAQRYWDTHIKPLMERLDKDLTPWLPQMAQYEIDTKRLRAAIMSGEASLLEGVIYELERAEASVEAAEVIAANDNALEQAEAPPQEAESAATDTAGKREPELGDETPVRIAAAINTTGVKVSQSRIKQAAKNREIRSKRSGTRKNSPYLVYPSEVKKKFNVHGQK